jgi:hypothetical protein
MSFLVQAFRYFTEQLSLTIFSPVAVIVPFSTGFFSVLSLASSFIPCIVGFETTPVRLTWSSNILR